MAPASGPDAFRQKPCILHEFIQPFPFISIPHSYFQLPQATIFMCLTYVILVYVFVKCIQFCTPAFFFFYIITMITFIYLFIYFYYFCPILSLTFFLSLYLYLYLYFYLYLKFFRTKLLSFPLTKYISIPYNFLKISLHMKIVFLLILVVLITLIRILNTQKP